MNEIDLRLTKLETKFKERWDAHDRRSDEMWTLIKDELVKQTERIGNINTILGDFKLDITTKFAKLPCALNTNQIRLMWGIITLVVIGGIVFGLWIKQI